MAVPPHTPLVLLAAIVASGVGFVAWFSRDAPGARTLAAFMLAAGVWALAEGLALASPAYAGKVHWTRVAWSVSSIVALAWLATVLAYTGEDDRLTPGRFGLLLVEPVAFVALVWTNESHELVWTDFSTTLGDGYVVLTRELGLAFWAHIGYTYLLIAVGAAVLVQQSLRTNSHFRSQGTALLVAVFVPMLANALTLFGVVPPQFDLTSIGFVVTGIVVAGAVFRGSLLSVTPATRELGRETVVDEMDDPVLILDADDRVVDLNPAAERLLGVTTGAVAGDPLSGIDEDLARSIDLASAMPVEGDSVATSDGTRSDAVRPDATRPDSVGTGPAGADPAEADPAGADPAGADPAGTDPPGVDPAGADSSGTDPLVADPTGTDGLGHVSGGQSELELDTPAGVRYFDVNVSSVDQAYGSAMGRVVSLRDVTGRYRREQRLDVLNRLLRHNLRNEMNVVAGNAELLREEVDATSTAEQRLDTVVETVEEIVRRSEKVGHLSRELDRDEVRRVDLATLVGDVVTDVRAAYPDATVSTDVPDDLSVTGGSSLELAVEELLTNAVEHSDRSAPSVAVSAARVGDVIVELRIADDGPGIDEQERTVIEEGRETPLQHGSGVGLWLVAWVVREYGGTVEFADRDDGCTVKLGLPEHDSGRSRAAPRKRTAPGRTTT